jgi:ElaB/YqjD/DUF883 family membrane-anchored ribosome-binding protein
MSMPDPKKPAQKSARNSTSTPGKASPQSTGDEVFSSSGTSKPPVRETGSKREEEGSAPADRPLSDVENLQQTATDYFGRLTSSAGDLSTQARRVYGSSQSFVRSHPGQTVGGAFLGGLVLGLLMGRD